MSDDEYEDDFEGEFIYFDEVEADLAVSSLFPSSPLLSFSPAFRLDADNLSL
jgi:hypothetical protein